MFGDDCTTACHCKTGNCSRYTGECREAGCVAGFYGTSCSTGISADRTTELLNMSLYAISGKSSRDLQSI